MTAETVSDSVTEQVGGWAGVLGIAIPTIGLAIFPIWRFPATTAPAVDVSAFVAAHRPALQAMMACYAVGVMLWLVFGAAVWARLRRSVPATSVLATGFAAGLTGFVTLLMAGFVFFDVLVYRPTTPSTARLLYDLTFGLLAMSGLPTAIALTAYAVAVRRGRFLPQRTGRLAALTAAAHLLLLASFVAGTGFLSLEGAVIMVVPGLLWVWIADTGVALLRIADH